LALKEKATAMTPITREAGEEGGGGEGGRRKRRRGRVKERRKSAFCLEERGLAGPEGGREGGREGE
jgi:hypothetical protein